MVHDVRTLRVSSIRIVLPVAAIMGFRLFSDYVTQEYFQSKSSLTREVYIRPRQDDIQVLVIGEGKYLS